MPIDPNNIALLLIALINIVTGYLAYRAHVIATGNQTNIKKIEVATNSMKDALVAATAKASFAAGQDQQRADTKAADALKAEGAAESKL